VRTIDMEVEGDDLLVSDSYGRSRERLENAMVVHHEDRRRPVVDAIGSASISPGAIPNPGADYRVHRPFDVHDFDPALAEGVLYYFLRRTYGAASIVRVILRSRGVARLRWAEWAHLSATDRRSFLMGVGRWADVEINGRSAASLSRLRSLFGKDPTIEEWATEAQAPTASRDIKRR
jgi:hypothetical protein